ncbi:flagellar motor stator protein MotA [Xanthomonas campestris pv. phormiicola]|nr:flagellar motor stator protein MotA [Xanthomonas campestris pv. phormiicola]UYC17866.1 flagellar motor stator protein MotA [Xanthomonas campestris pv. phormiicola]
MQQLVGIGIVLCCVFGGFLMMGGSPGLIWQPVELVIIVGAALGALVVGNPRHVLLELLSQLRKVFVFSKRGTETENERHLMLLLYELLQLGRDLKALDVHVESPEQSPIFQRYPLVLQSPRLVPFIVDNFRLMALGRITAHELEGVLEQELESIYGDLVQPSKSLRKIGDAMPGFGIVAAVLGVVMAMSSVAQGASSGEIAERVAAAMIGTFMGIFLCYGVLDPLSNLISQAVKNEVAELECIKVALVAYAAGKPPLLALDAGRRLMPLNIKPSFAQLETWITRLDGAAA